MRRLRGMYQGLSQRSHFRLERMLRPGVGGALRRMRSVRQNLSRRMYFREEKEHSGMKQKHWYDYLWIWTIVYFVLGFFNILFA